MEHPDVVHAELWTLLDRVDRLDRNGHAATMDA
jgi:hypothetical protein